MLQKCIIGWWCIISWWITVLYTKNKTTNLLIKLVFESLVRSRFLASSTLDQDQEKNWTRLTWTSLLQVTKTGLNWSEPGYSSNWLFGLV